MTTPALPSTNVEITNAALTKLGDDPISGFDEETDRSQICNRLYEPTVAMLLSKNRWRFAVKFREQLTQDSWTPPDNSFWRFRYVLPNDLVYVVRTYNNRMFEIYAGNLLYSNAHEEFVDYVFRPNESAWPSYFIAAVVDYLAVELALPIGQQDQIPNMERQAQRSWLNAAFQDSASRPSDPIVDSPLVDVRYMGTYGNGGGFGG